MNLKTVKIVEAGCGTVLEDKHTQALGRVDDEGKVLMQYRMHPCLAVPSRWRCVLTYQMATNVEDN